MKKLIITISIFAICVLTSPTYFSLDAPYEGNEGAWEEFCNSEDLSENELSKCQDFKQYLADESDALSQEKEQIDRDLEILKSAIEEQGLLIAKYSETITEYETLITELEEKIAIREEAIINKTEDIIEKETQVSELEIKLTERMTSSQQTMHFNDALSFLMGASTIEDFIRRANGINSMEAYESELKFELITILGVLEQDKALLQQDRDIVEQDKIVLDEALATVEQLKYEVEQAKIANEAKEAELEAQGNTIAGNIEELQETLASLSDSIGGIPSSSSFTRPIENYGISAYTWAYPNGGLHLGTDYTASRGTTVRAAINGVVVFSNDGCGDGYLGATCAGTPEATYGGGNSVYLMGEVDGKIYGFRYLHLLINTSVEAGTVVNAGDYIGGMGTSGNSSGVHTHVEVIYMGDGELEDYINDWQKTGDLSFGAGFGYSALSTICENGASAPCRMRPEEVFNTW